LPHLDYCLQKFGPDFSKISTELGEIDKVVEGLVTFYQNKNAEIIILSEYGIAPVNNPIHLNRLLRKEGLIQIRVERGLELLDAAASKAVAIADHQIAHIYINDSSVIEKVKSLLKGVKGIELILDREAQKQHHIDHERAGDIVVVADKDSWFTYYFWLDDALAPDYARCVDIHKKPGYDPVEMFMTSKARAGYKLLRKLAGFRYVMDVIPLDATLIKGSHGRTNIADEYKAILITNEAQDQNIQPTAVFDVMWAHLNKPEKH